MADDTLDIYLRIITQEVGQEKADAILKRVREETKESSRATAQATEVTKENTKAVEGQLSSKQQLRGALRGLSSEFPILGRVASMVMNPMTLSVAGILAAFNLWRARVDELAKSLAAVELPQMGQTELGLIEKYSRQMGELADKTDLTREAMSLLKKELEDISAIEESGKLFGIEPGSEGALARMEARERMAQVMEERGRAMVRAAEGIRPDDPKLQADQKAAAEAAQRTISESQQRLGQIADWQDSPVWRRPLDDFRFRMRYGYGTTYDQARAMENERIAQARSTLGQFAAFQAGAQRRAQIRAGGEQGRQLIEQAGALRAENIAAGRVAIRGQFENFFSAGGGIQGPAGGGTTEGQMQTMQQAAAGLATARNQLSEIIRILNHLFKDGIVTPAELAQLRNLAANQRRN